ncbi:glycosyltransferase family 2 protein [Candidatus Pelagibacter sp.]|nr:glycosyltransferase family 2 protein [Candidatus Pelagibacter sp.]
MNKISLSVVAPAYNESASIKKILDEWFSYLMNSEFISDYEVIITNDGSTDSTLEILESVKLNNKNLKIIDFKKNKGAATALYTAIDNASHDWILLMDSDGQYPIHYLESMFNILNLDKNIDCVFGSRIKKDGSLLERIGSRSSSLICNLFYQSNIKDFSSIFKLVKSDILKNINLEAKGMNYSVDITAKLFEAKTRNSEIFVQSNLRIGGNSNIKFLRDGFRRVLFLSYLFLRKILIKLNIL